MSRGEVFTADELARAALVDVSRVRALVASGELRPIAGTHFFSGADAVRVGRVLRAEAVAGAAAPPAELFDRTTHPPRVADRRDGVRAGVSSLVHATVVGTLIWATASAPQSAPAPDEPREAPRMVFLMTPGPGGGGGGGGLRHPRPAPTVQRRGPSRRALTVPAVTPDPVITTARREEPPRELTPAPTPVEPKPVERAPEPLPARVLVAPVVSTPADSAEREGVIEQGVGDAPSQGAGVGGGAGSGQGTGNGEGNGSGIGDGSGGGTGGGPFRPGSGIEPPRLLREVKADYTEDARRRGLQGDVVLEIVVRRDGSVGDVTVLQGLGAGLDQRAIAAVRQWRFAPARRRGDAVDVIVEVAVEFTLR